MLFLPGACCLWQACRALTGVPTSLSRRQPLAAQEARLAAEKEASSSGKDKGAKKKAARCVVGGVTAACLLLFAAWRAAYGTCHYVGVNPVFRALTSPITHFNGNRAPDPDPDGAKLAATEDPLGEATKLVLRLKQHAPSDLRTHLAAFEVYVRKGRALLALGAAQRAAAIAGAEDGDVHRCIVRLALAGATDLFAVLCSAGGGVTQCATASPVCPA